VQLFFEKNDFLNDAEKNKSEKTIPFDDSNRELNISQRDEPIQSEETLSNFYLKRFTKKERRKQRNS